MTKIARLCRLVIVVGEENATVLVEVDSEQNMYSSRSSFLENSKIRSTRQTICVCRENFVRTSLLFCTYLANASQL